MGAEKIEVVSVSLERLEQYITKAVNDAVKNVIGGGAREEYLRLDEAAKLINVSEKTVKVWIRTKGLPATQVGRDYRFQRELLVAWLQEQAVKPGVHVTKAVERLDRVKNAASE